MKILTCTCCGADITAPQFHNGLPYGYTCIKKVDPARKQSKAKFYEVEGFKAVRERIQFGGERQKITLAVFTFKGNKYSANVFASQMVEQDGTVFVSEHVFKDAQKMR